LRVEPGAVGSGITYRLEVEPGSLLPSFLKAIDETVRSALDQGVHGWQVTDIIVTLTHSGYWARPFSAAGDFRDLTPLVLLHALALADTCVFEPCHRFELEIPLDQIGPITAELGRLEARIDTTDDVASAWHITGEIPARLVHVFQRRLPSLSNGQGVWSSRSAGDRAITGLAPQRRRSDGNPLDRTEYMRFLAQRSLDPMR
jgi:ribosomal protection tetracycline resistance protein